MNQGVTIHMKSHPQPYRLRLRFHGISHGIKSVHRTLFALPAAGPAFRFPHTYFQIRTAPLTGCCSYLEQGTGIEPAFTAWEAVVLPIYEPCMLGYYTKPFCKNQPFFVAPGKRTCRWKTAAWRFIYPKLPDSIYKPERRRIHCQTGQPQPAGQLHPAPAAALPSAQWHRPCFGDR